MRAEYLGLPVPIDISRVDISRYLCPSTGDDDEGHAGYQDTEALGVVGARSSASRMMILAGNCAGQPTAPGQWQVREFDWWRDPQGREQRGPALVFGCPNGRGVCSMPIAPAPANSNGARWTWDGDRERPTLTPSIHCVALRSDGSIEPGVGCGFHGHMTRGVLA